VFHPLEGVHTLRADAAQYFRVFGAHFVGDNERAKLYDVGSNPDHPGTYVIG